MKNNYLYAFRDMRTGKLVDVSTSAWAGKRYYRSEHWANFALKNCKEPEHIKLVKFELVEVDYEQ